MQVYYRHADSIIEHRDEVNGLELLEKMRDVYLDCPAQYKDQKIKDTLRKAVHTVETCDHFISKNVDVESIKSRAKQLVAWVESEVLMNEKKAVEKATHFEEGKGEIIKLYIEKNIGFIRTVGDKNIFFHKSGFSNQNEWEKANIGDVVLFETEDGKKGPVAINIRYMT
jgi:cold shock CspA family protein